MISCSKCEVQYVGLTSQKIRDRIGQHIRHIKKNDLSTFLVRHFNNTDHDINDVRVSIIDYITDDMEDTNELLMLENYWIRTLNTMYPFGLNDNIKGVGNISRSDISSFNASNTPYFSVSQYRKVRSHGHRGNSKKRNSKEVSDVLNQLLIVSNKHIHLLYVALRSLSHKILYKIREIVLNSPERYSKIFNHTILAFTSKLIIPKIPKIKDRLVLVLPYLNKIMDQINLSGVLNCKKLKSTLPANLKFTEKPVISYQFSRTIGQSLFNYNKVLRELSVSDFEHLSCDCDKDKDLAPYVYQPHGHVHTGNLDIIELLELRNLMKKGARFREVPFVNPSKYFSEICLYLDKFVQKWAGKEGICPSSFDKWSKLLKNIIKSKIRNIHFTPARHVLQADDVKQYISGLHTKFVICPIDKAGHNFAIVCKKFYIDILKKELGVHHTVMGNEVYKPVKMALDDLVSQHVQRLDKDFNIKLKDDDKNIPLIYWISKQHKNPYKFRFISGASHCTTKPLSVELSLILKLIKDHFKNYCKKIYNNSGLHLYWSIDNSLECLQKISKLEATSIHTYDFSTLYTNLPLEDIFEKLSSLICRMFKNAYSRYILVNTYTNKAFWSNEDKRGYNCYTLQHVLDALEFILYNTYIIFGENIFLQTRGIPMGGNASPLIADLYLSWLEYIFLSKLVKKDASLVHKLSHNCRYIDDIATPNFCDFLKIASRIYPKEIPLEPNIGNGKHDTFLDLDISVCDSSFVFKIFHKVDLFNFEVISFPFLDSNIPHRICYSTFFSQLIRFVRICSNVHGFAERVKLLWNKLLDREYDVNTLHTYFNKFLCQYSEEVMKYGHNIPDLLQFCLNFDASHNTSLQTNLCQAFSDVSSANGTHDINTSSVVNTFAAFRSFGPVPLANLKNTCYLNCILQILFQINNVFSFECWSKHLMHIDESLLSNSIQVLLFNEFLNLCKLHVISRTDLVNFMNTLNKYDPLFNSMMQRDAHEAFTVLLEAFNSVCRIPKTGEEFSDIPEFMDYYFCGVFKKKFICAACHEENIFFENFRHFIVQPSEDITSFLGNLRTEQKKFTCDKCHLQNFQMICVEIHEFPRILLFQVSRFTASNIHHRNRKDNQFMNIYEKVKLGFVEYKLLGLIEHLGVLVDSGHYTCLVNHNFDWFHCNDINIEKAILPCSSQNSYLLFYSRQ